MSAATALPLPPPGGSRVKTRLWFRGIRTPDGECWYFESEDDCWAFTTELSKLGIDYTSEKPDEIERIVQQLNSRHVLLTCVGGKARITTVVQDSFGRPKYELQDRANFCLAYANQRNEKKSIAELWLQHPLRRQAKSFCYRPLEAETVDGNLNLWTGYGVTAAAGDWSLMRAHILDVLADGDQTAADYIIRWAAWTVQHPGEPSEVALVFKGKKGTGKGAFASALTKLFGNHGLQIFHPKHLTGNFNRHLEDCSLLYADEAIAPNDKAAESVLKGLVTEKLIAIERKGVDAYQARNVLSIVMSSNEGWCVPAGVDERRFAVFNVSSKRMRTDEYFRALFTERDEHGGLAAMLYDLQRMNLGDWHPRYGVPQTAGLAEQKARGFRGADRVVHLMLESGNAYGAVAFEGETVFVNARQAALMAEGGDEKRALALETHLARVLGKKVAPMPSGAETSSTRHTVNGKQVRGHWLPALQTARANWERNMGLGSYTWNSTQSWEGAADPAPEEVPF